MATTRIMPLHIGKGRTESQAVSDIIDYVSNPQKTDNGRPITGFACDSRIADAEFLLAKRKYISTTGRVRGADDVLAYHVRQSFVPSEITPEEANQLGVEFAKRFTKGNNAFVVCTHIHNHIIWNAVNLNCDRKFRNFWGSTRAVRRLNDTICVENGYSMPPLFLCQKSNQSMTENVSEIAEALKQRDTRDMALWFADIAADGTEREERKQAMEFLGKLAEYKPLAKIEEMEEQNYNMIDNVLNNGAGENAQKEENKKASDKPAAKPSLKARLAEKKEQVAGQGREQEENIKNKQREM